MLVSLRDQRLLLYLETDTTGADHFPKAQYVFTAYAWGRISAPGGKEIALAEATEQKIDAVISLSTDDARLLTTQYAVVKDPDDGKLYRLRVALSQRLHGMVKFITTYVPQDQLYDLVGP